MRIPRPIVGFILELLAWAGVFVAGVAVTGEAVTGHLFGYVGLENDMTVAFIFGASLTYLRRYRNFR